MQGQERSSNFSNFNSNKETEMKGSLKKFAFILFAALAVLAGEAMAQCGGKTVYVELPNAGWSKTQVHVKIDGMTTIPATAQGRWVVFTFPSTSQELTGTGKSFALSNNASESGSNSWISNTQYNYTGQQANRISCDNLASPVWIYENPAVSGTTVVSSTAPDAYVFYFLPPNVDEWIVGTPYYIYSDGGLKRIPMQPSEYCGWFKLQFFPDPVPARNALIWIGPTRDVDQVGLYGMMEDRIDWKGETEEDKTPTPFNLKEQFNAVLGENKPGDLYFSAQTGDWSANPPSPSEVNASENQKRCKYDYAAIIYDTDNTVNNSFFIGGTGTGIIKGIPAKTLVRDPASGKMKMAWGNRTGNNDGWTSGNFIDAFKPTTGKNIERCYNMPFKRSRSGLWEFNSNKMCADGSVDLEGDCSGMGGYMGGFFPPEMQTTGGVDYSSCTACNTPRAAGAWVPMNTSGSSNDNMQPISQFCYDRGRMGMGTGDISNCGVEVGTVSADCNNDNPAVASQGNTFCNGGNPKIWNWGQRATMAGGATTKNAFYCFESTPADFTYEAGQQFFFTGDDDIWVYIDNQLQIDLGGTHLAAPGFIDLDKVIIPAGNRDPERKYTSAGGLVEGEKYPINVFFCDRRTDMSNVRIATNMYFSQTNGLYVDGAINREEAPICFKSSGGGSCTSSSDGTLACADQIGQYLKYFIVKRGSDAKIYLDGDNEACTMQSGGDILRCYGGITIQMQGGKVKVDNNAIVGGLSGTYYVYAEAVPVSAAPWKLEPPDPEQIARIMVNANIFAVWGDIYDESTRA